MSKPKVRKLSKLEALNKMLWNCLVDYKKIRQGNLVGYHIVKSVLGNRNEDTLDSRLSGIFKSIDSAYFCGMSLRPLSGDERIDTYIGVREVTTLIMLCIAHIEGEKIEEYDIKRLEQYYL